MTMGRWLLVAALAAGGYRYWHTHKSMAPAVGVATSMDRAWNAYGYQITPLEKFNFEARVLRAEHYSMDREAQLAPVDLALGWGPMANPAVIDKVKITQSSRFLLLARRRVSDSPPRHRSQQRQHAHGAGQRGGRAHAAGPAFRATRHHLGLPDRSARARRLALAQLAHARRHRRRRLRARVGREDRRELISGSRL